MPGSWITRNVARSDGSGMAARLEGASTRSRCGAWPRRQAGQPSARPLLPRQGGARSVCLSHSGRPRGTAGRSGSRGLERPGRGGPNAAPGRPAARRRPPDRDEVWFAFLGLALTRPDLAKAQRVAYRAWRSRLAQLLRARLSVRAGSIPPWTPSAKLRAGGARRRTGGSGDLEPRVFTERLLTLLDARLDRLLYRRAVIARPLRFEDDALHVLDQRALPAGRTGSAASPRPRWPAVSATWRCGGHRGGRRLDGARAAAW